MIVALAIRETIADGCDVAQMDTKHRADADAFVERHEHGNVYQLAAWRDAITRGYGHLVPCLIATRSGSEAHSVSGHLPLVHIHHWLFGNSLVSMPFCDGGGLLAEDPGVARRLIEDAVRLANAERVSVLELRQYEPLSCLKDGEMVGVASTGGWQPLRHLEGWHVRTSFADQKVRMVADLPNDPDALMRSFNAKLRSQIRRPLKDGLTVEVGGVELLDAFFEVFAENMRDLGSPVHARSLFKAVLRAFGEHARLFIVQGAGVPLACSMTVGFRDILSNPWASALRKYSQLAPNMLLYWAMLEYGCQQGYKRFDFGRSTVVEGTYRFKEQWGARPEALFWYRFVHESHAKDSLPIEGDNRRRAAEYWKRLPVSVTKVLGPRIRRYISL